VTDGTTHLRRSDELRLHGVERPVRLSLLDLVPVARGTTPGQALHHSTRLVRRAEELGYHRYWVAEHHSMPGIASSSPAVLLAHLATATEHMRLGSGGVMLPNHSPLVVAEQFGMLESLHPGRIDLGLGRAPGTDGVTARALRRSDQLSDGEDFPQQLAELVAFLDGTFPPEHPYASVKAVPHAPTRPDIWLLGSSGYSAQLAGLLGLPFSFAHHFSAANTEPALELYRRAFRPSETLDEPYAMIGVSVVCADTAEHARWLAAPQGLAMLRLRTGRPGPQPTPEEAAAHSYTPAETELVRSITGSHVVGDPEQVRAELLELAGRTGVDELMVTTNVGDAAERLRSYELVARLARQDVPAPASADG
jgi:luciferase family oxidoreductase group 1